MNTTNKARNERIDIAHRNAAALDFARRNGCVIPQECYDRVWSDVDAGDTESKCPASPDGHDFVRYTREQIRKGGEGVGTHYCCYCGADK